MSQVGEPVTDSEPLDEVRTADGRGFTAKPTARTAEVAMPEEFEPRRLARRTLHVVVPAHLLPEHAVAH
jgi:hypothetical protein